MGDNTRVSGEIKIEPPLTYADFRDSEFRPHQRNTTLMINEKLDTVETPTGVNHNMTGVGIVFRFPEPGRHYGIEAELIRIIQRWPDREFIGALMLIGPEPEEGGIVRYRITPHIAKSEHGIGLRHDIEMDRAEIRWPDGSKVEF